MPRRRGATVHRPGRGSRRATSFPTPTTHRPRDRAERDRHRVAAVHAVARHLGQAAAVLPVLDGARPLLLVGTPLRPAPAAPSTHSSDIVSDSSRSRTSAPLPVSVEERRYRDADASGRRLHRRGAARGRRARRDATTLWQTRAQAQTSVTSDKEIPTHHRRAPTTDKNGVQHLHFEYGPLDIRPGQNIIDDHQVPDPAARGGRLDRRLPAEPPPRGRHGPARRRHPPAPRRVAQRIGAATRPRRCSRSASSPPARRRPRSSCPRGYGYRVHARRTSGSSTT